MSCNDFLTLLLGTSFGEGVSQVDRVVGHESVADSDLGIDASTNCRRATELLILLRDKFSGHPGFSVLLKVGLNKFGAINKGGHEV